MKKSKKRGRLGTSGPEVVEIMDDGSWTHDPVLKVPLRESVTWLARTKSFVLSFKQKKWPFNEDPDVGINQNQFLIKLQAGVPRGPFTFKQDEAPPKGQKRKYPYEIQSGTLKISTAAKRKSGAGTEGGPVGGPTVIGEG
jgi:hypothetical protein